MDTSKLCKDCKKVVLTQQRSPVKQYIYDYQYKNWHCDDCDQDVIMAHKSRHKKTKKHLRNVKKEKVYHHCYCLIDKLIEEDDLEDHLKSKIHKQRCENLTRVGLSLELMDKMHNILIEKRNKTS